MRSRWLRALLAAVVLLVTFVVAARGAGPVPALGALLEPAHGVWAMARARAADRGAVAGLGDSVRVVYDARAVPHVFARREEDAYRALGYVVARDRLFQLYVQNLAATGRLTEIAGAPALDADREMRRLGLPRAAERKLALLGDTARSVRIARAYADGVNAYIDQLTAATLPMEFRLLGKRPERWSAVNALYLLGRMGWTLAYLRPEVQQAIAATAVGTRAAAALFPANSPIVEPIQPNGQHAPRFDFAPLPPPGAPAMSPLVGVLRQLMPATTRVASGGVYDGEPRAFASNNWAVAPGRARDGHALLAGDPHLELTLPSIWYEAHLVVPGALDVAGVTIPGAPGIVIGVNRDVAWTFTNTGADVLDFYRETVDDSLHPTRYMLDGRWRPLELRVERYRGKRGETIATDTLRFTHRGPMRRQDGQWISMRWTVLEPSDELAAFQEAAKARTAREFEEAMARHYFVPAQNMLAADREGAIAIRSTGHFPVRPGDGSGLEVRDGSRSASDWQGWLPVERYPQAFAPAQGYLASANQQPVDPRATTDYWGGSYEPWRALRINTLLRADSQVTVDDMRRFQTDPGGARADLLVPHFLAAAKAVLARPESGAPAEKLRRAAALLGEWDRRYTRENTRAVLFEAAMREAKRRAFDELAVEGDRGVRVATPDDEVFLELMSDSASVWWDDHRTPRVEDRDELLAESLVAALDTTVARYGAPDGGGWRWSRIGRANIWNLLRLPGLSALELPVPGGPSTLWPVAGRGVYGPSWRMVVELGGGPTLRAWGTYPGGQSGDPASPHYRDRLPLWLEGKLEPLALPRDLAEARALGGTTELTLAPRGAP